MMGVGRSDGEGIERCWAHINDLGPATREMSLGNCHDTLDDNWGSWNWRKIIGMG
jgi:hypothetical protein